MAEKKPTGLALLRVPFTENQISKLPKATKAQNEALKADFKKGIRCELCGGWHLPEVIHLDYVGHAALTDRLLDADENWTWEPLSIDQDGLPRLDRNGGLWIRLTVCGQTRLGYGNAEGKSGGDAIKEIIGDALRNAAMRFGAALDLWHKGDLHIEETPPPEPKKENKKPEFTSGNGLSKPIPPGINKVEVKTAVGGGGGSKASSPQKFILPSWGGSNKGKAIGTLDTPTLEKLKAYLKEQLFVEPPPKHIKEIPAVLANIKAVLADRNPTPPPSKDMPDSVLPPTPEDESQAFPPDDGEPMPPTIDDFEIPKGVLPALDDIAGIPLKRISEKELRAAQKILTDEMAKGPKSKISAGAGFELRNKITEFFNSMGG